MWLRNLTEDIEKLITPPPPHLRHFKPGALLCSHLWLSTEVITRKPSIGVTIINLSARVTERSNRWPWKTIGHLLYADSSFVLHFIAICEFKLDLHSKNGRIRATFILISVTFQMPKLRLKNCLDFCGIPDANTSRLSDDLLHQLF